MKDGGNLEGGSKVMENGRHDKVRSGWGKGWRGLNEERMEDGGKGWQQTG